MARRRINQRLLNASFTQIHRVAGRFSARAGEMAVVIRKPLWYNIIRLYARKAPYAGPNECRIVRVEVLFTLF